MRDISIADGLKKYMLITGGAEGSDSYFIGLAERWCMEVTSYSFINHDIYDLRGRIILTSNQLVEADYSVKEILGDRWINTFKENTRNLWRRNRYQFLDSDQAFVIVQDLDTLFDFSGKRISGSAMVPLWYLLERQSQSNLFIYDQIRQEWFVPDVNGSLSTLYIKWVNGELVKKIYRWKEIPEDTVLISSKKFAGIGTRELTPHARNSMERLFQRSFNLGNTN